LIDALGHIKLADFGLATDFSMADPDEDVKQDEEKNSSTHRKFSIVGTMNYIAPEVISGKGYDHTCDWWSLGIILFECIFGYPPFCSKTQNQSQLKIISWKKLFFIPNEPECSEECKDFLTKLICDSNKRLGSGIVRRHNLDNSTSGIVKRILAKHGDAEDIKAHAWFQGLNWDTLHDIPAPFIPDIESVTDVSNFENVDEEEVKRMINGSRSDVKAEALSQNFDGFSFINASVLNRN
jgi:protein-serine/threonine kinase